MAPEAQESAGRAGTGERGPVALIVLEAPSTALGVRLRARRFPAQKFPVAPRVPTNVFSRGPLLASDPTEWLS